MKKFLSRKNIAKLLLSINFFIFIAAAMHLTFFDMSDFSAKTVQVSSIIDFGMIIFFLIFVSMQTTDLSEDVNFLFIIFVSLLNLNLFSFGATISTIHFGSDFNSLSMFFLTAGYIFSNFLCYFCYIFFVKMYDKNFSDNPLEFKIMNSICAIGAVLIIGNIFFGYYFNFSDDGNVTATSPIDLVVDTIMFIFTLKFVYRQKISMLKKIFITTATVILLSSGIVMYSEGFCWSFIIQICYAISVYTELYKRREIKLIQKKSELLQTELHSLHLQMNPHFIYNTLASVAGLCYQNSKSAENMIVKFSNYLRANFTDMNNKIVRSFDEEILNIEEYFAIEKIRFPNIEIFYDLRVKNFNLPSMTIQPLVENAIKHGICKRRRSIGKIFIKSFEDEDNFFVEIKDDGVGFKNFSENIKHIGIRNVRLRLKILFGGSLEIKSIPDVGTTVEVKIPKQS